MLLVEPVAHHGLAQLSRWREPLPCTCVGAPGAAIDVVYLHGLDTYGPSWIEIENRAKLRALAYARIALPRAGGRWHENTPDVVRSAAATCFAGRPFILLGFSDGANAVNRLYLQCRTDITSAFISIGSSEGSPGRATAACGHLTLIAGRHEPGFATTRLFARRLAKRGGNVTFVEHSGPHEIPLRELATVLRDRATTPPLRAIVLALLAGSAALLRHFQTFRFGTPLLAVACACALAIGNAPGLFLTSLSGAAIFVAMLAVVAGFAGGPAATATPRIAVVIFCAAAGAVWQLLVVPFLAIAFVRA